MRAEALAFRTSVQLLELTLKQTLGTQALGMLSYNPIGTQANLDTSYQCINHNICILWFYIHMSIPSYAPLWILYLLFTLIVFILYQVVFSYVSNTCTRKEQMHAGRDVRYENAPFYFCCFGICYNPRHMGDFFWITVPNLTSIGHVLVGP